MSFYDTLGVSQDVDQDGLKKAYHTLAFEYHPDRNPTGETRFKEVRDAYGVLSDPLKRAAYDESLEPRNIIFVGTNSSQNLGDLLDSSRMRGRGRFIPQRRVRVGRLRR